MSTSSTVPLREQQAGIAGLGSILAAGADARSFLQGQLTADLDTLDPHRVLLAACNSPQGRVQAVVWMVERSDAIALILPNVMVDTITNRLRKYVLRSKVQIARGPDVAILSRATLPAPFDLCRERVHHEHAGISYISLPGHDQVLALSTEPVTSTEDAQVAGAQWHLDDIRSGLPHVYPRTHEAFVAQMLNLDLLDGISFDKGCYTGQEIIARTHYRGAIKRRMFRYTASCPPPAPGTRLVIGEQHAGDVVDAAATNGGCELLAVVSLAQAEERLQLDASPTVELEKASLPYAVGGMPPP